jgi:GT2 family glycosyltransferase
MNTVSIILVTYNGISFLLDCLNSVKNELDADCEVIIIDNSSTDGSPQLVANEFPSFKLISNKKNIGFAAACNQGAELATGRYLVFLNQDTVVFPGWLSELIESFENNNAIGITTSKILLMSDQEIINSCGLDIHYSGLSFARGYKELAKKFSHPEYVPAVSGASFAISADLWAQLGGFDESYFMYYEETDLSWRAQLAGYNCLLVPDSVIQHAHSSRPSMLSVYYSERNRWIMLLKNWRLLTLFLLSPGLVLTELAEWVYLIMMGKEAIRAKIRADMWILANLPNILEKRKKIQSQRVVHDYEILLNRTYKLSPAERTGGYPGKFVTAMVNPIFRVIYRACLYVLQTLNY